ncbi:MAG: hypothetical protein WKG00_21780 [Polyangiaceae bacterium]
MERYRFLRDGRAAALAGAMVAAAAPACSLLTDFPDVVASSAGGGGSGGAGGGGCGECRNCYEGARACPEVASIFDVQAPTSTPGPGANTNVAVNDGVSTPSGVRLVGSFRNAGGAGLQVGGSTLTAMGDRGMGFVVGEDGTLLIGAGPCTDRSERGGDEVFFMSAAAVNDMGSELLVVGGAFEGRRLVFTGNTLDCGNTSNGVIEGPTAQAPTDFVPFLAWLDALTGQGINALAPTQSFDGYFADVAAIPEADDGSVVAIGLARGNPFAVSPTWPDFQYFVARVVGPSGGVDASTVALDYRTCLSDHYATLDGLRASIAADHAVNDAFVGGTGCPVAAPQDQGDRSFLGRIGLDGELDPEPFRTFGGAGNPVAITEVAVSTLHVVVAGTYSGNPGIELTGGGQAPAGTDSDGFVMAFARDGWSNTSNPVWFLQITSNAGPASIRDLKLADDRIYVAGSIAESGEVGDVEACVETPSPDTRAFFAEILADTGTAAWFRVEGSAVGGTDPAPFFATGTTVVRTADVLVTATGTHGELVLGCGESSTNTLDRPQVTVRRLELAP